MKGGRLRPRGAAPIPDETDGFVPVEGFRLFYRTFGNPDAPATVLGLHGGPGMSHDYLLPFAKLTRFGYRVVLFDQLGCGRSEVPPDRERFSLEHNVLEADAVRTALGLGRVHLIGSSYGGLLAIAYALRHPEGLRSLVTVGGLASVPFAQAEMNRRVDELPEPARRAIRELGARGALSHPDYVRATDLFYHEYVCRLAEWPPELNRSLEVGLERPVYRYMNGPNEFTITGTIRDIDLSPQLGRIRVPTLVLGGRYDEVTPAVAEQIERGIPGARRVTFERSAHLPFWEEPDRFLEVVGRFLREVDART